MNDRCWKCDEEIEEYCYSATIYFLDGSEETIEEVIYNISGEDMELYEKNIRKEYDNVDYVGFGEFCPYCLASI
ncbi:MAG: hypothetical protein E6538_13320 [Paeniclostridium sordellii]|nr:hypothetical protein [Paeniclostridium sordellii]